MNNKQNNTGISGSLKDQVAPTEDSLPNAVKEGVNATSQAKTSSRNTNLQSQSAVSKSQNVYESLETK